MSENIRLVIADVDGTLVTKEKVLTRRALDAVKRLRDAGIAFSITSGRPPLGMKMLIDPLELNAPIGAFNGGVFVCPDLSVLAQRFIPEATAVKAIEHIVEHGLDCWVYTDTEWLVRDLRAPHVAHEEWTVKFPPVVSEFGSHHLTRVVKIVGVSDDYGAVAHCEKEVQQDCGTHVSATRSQPYYLDVTNPNANKGQVVAFLSQTLSIPADQIATIGDMPNDVLMFERSGLSIAMGNASSEVQARANFVTTSNEEDGFANAIERFILTQPHTFAGKAR
jgi:Cof subfamily protein (haloacid dehalogenase superfamily)